MSFQLIQNSPKTQSDYGALCQRATLTLPKTWRWKLHPLLEAESSRENKLEDAVIDGMKRLKLVTTAKEEEAVRRMNVRGYGGYAFPSGDWNRLYLNAFYVTLWLYWDDRVVENSTKELDDFEDVVSAIAGEPMSRNADRYALAWRYVADELMRAGASKQYMAQLAAKMKQWLIYAIQERKRAAAVRDPSRTDLYTYSDYLHQRMVTIGMIPTAQLIEQDVGFERMANYSHLPEIDELVECSGYLVAYMNELVSTAKDGKQKYSNLTQLGMSKYHMTLPEIKDYVVNKHAETVKRYDQLESLILRQVADADREKMQNWIQALRLAVSGFEYWHLTAPRYTAHFKLENEFTLQTTIEIVDEWKIH